MILALVGVLAPFLGGCPGRQGDEGQPKEPPRGGEAEGKAPEASAEGAAAGEKGTLATMASLRPMIREVAEDGVVPSRIVVEFAERIVSSGTTNPGGSRLTIEPTVPGTLRFAGESTLEFTPTDGFSPGARYLVTLDAIETARGLVRASSSEWQREFTTPPFRLLRADLHAIDVKRKRVEIDLVYSAAIDTGSLESRGTWTLNGTPMRKVSYARTERRNVARATLTDKRVGDGVEIRFDQSDGVSSSMEPSVRAPSGFVSLTTPRGKPIEIFASTLREGGSGFYVQVVCRDLGAGEETMYYWDDRTYDSYQVSQRCVLEESDAKSSIHFTPEVRFSLTPTRGGFRILGDFKRGSYSMRIDADARSIDGGTLLRPYETSFSVPARSPDVGFVAQGRYLPRTAWKSLAIRHRNVSEIGLKIRQIPPENLSFWISAEQETADDRVSTLILDKKIPVRSEPDELATTWLEVAELVPNPGRGVLELELFTPSKQARARLLVTDLNLLAKRQKGSNDVAVFLLDVHTNRPVTGGRAKMLAKSGRVISTCTTDLSGFCALAGVDPKAVDQSPPFAIVAALADDLTYLPFETLELHAEESSVGGLPYTSEGSPYRVALYSDRGVYRPGDVARVVAVIRDRSSVAPKTGMPVDVQLIDPRGKVAKKFVRTTNEAGLVSVDVPFESFADTGRYALQVLAGGKLLGAYSLSVEEFVPERMKVEAKAKKSELLATDSAEFDVEARYLFGGSAEGARVELNCRLEAATLKPKKNSEFSYGIWREKPPSALPLGSASGVLDANGRASLQCPSLSARGGFGSTAKLVADVAVFEGGSGRSTQTAATALVHPAAFYLGLSASVTKAKVGERFTVKGLVVDWTGERRDDVSEVEIELLHVEQEHDWVYERSSGSWNYRHYSRLSSDGKQKVKVSRGAFEATLEVGAPAQSYVVRAMAGGVQSDLTVEGEAGYLWWYSETAEDKTPRPGKPTNIELQLPKEIDVGQEVEVVFDAPFEGRALLTVETDRLLKREWLDVAPGRANWHFKVESFVPNVYVSVFCMKNPHADSEASFVPHRAFGVESVRVLPRDYAEKLTITVPSEVRSRSKLDIDVSVGSAKEPTYVTVAAVDEGILSLTRFESPDPLAEIFARRQLEVTTFETIGWNLLLPAGGPSGSTGGDGGSTMGRPQPVKPVVLWSGVVRIPENGRTRISMDVPEYRGALRVMAVTVGPKRIGAASKQVVVKDPLVVQTTLPRFMIYGDALDIPVAITNLSGAKRTIDVSVDVEPLSVGGAVDEEESKSELIRFVDGKEKRLEIDDNKSATAVFEIKAMRAVGAAKLRVRAASKDLVSEESLDVPFVPAAPRSRRVERVELAQGKNDLKKYLSGWLPTTERTSFWVTANPYGQSFSHLSHLVRYPYGCIEQTTSSTRPLLYVGRFLANIDPALTAADRIEDMVIAGVNRIFSMQTPSGGFGYWPGDHTPSLWASAYAAHFLLDAKKLNYPVSDARLDDAFEWMEGVLNDPPSDWDFRMAEPYLHYVLSMAGRGRSARMLALVEELSRRKSSDDAGETLEGLLMLKAGLYVSGDRRFEADIKKPDVSPVTDTRRNGWSFYSDRRRRGLALSIYTDLFGADPAAEPLANLVASAIEGRASGWYTTQELVWSITGLGKYVGNVAKSFAPPVLRIDGRAVDPTSASEERSDRSWSVYRASERKAVELEVDKKDPNDRVFLVISSEGVAENAKYAVGGAGLALTREYRTPSGEMASDDQIKLAELVYAVIRVTNRTSEAVQNIAIVDRFPAGFEIENPRLGRGGAIGWISESDLFAASYMNLRDDRVEYFGSLGANESKTVVYALRAVTAGSFSVPPIEAEAMYDPSRWARETGGRVTIRGPWHDRAE